MVVEIDFSVFYVLFCFLLILVVTRKALLTPLDKILNERKQQIDGDRIHATDSEETIERLKAEINEKLTKARTEAFATRQAIRSESLETQKTITDDARKTSSEKIMKAEKKVQSLVVEANNQMKSESDEIAAGIAANILGRPV